MTQRLEELLSATAEGASPAITNSNFFKLLKFVNAHYMEDISLAGTAAILHMNPNYVSQMFRRETGETFTRYITDLRITQAKKLLRTEDSAISDIALSVGFNDYFYFLKTFKKSQGKPRASGGLASDKRKRAFVWKQGGC